VGRGRGKAEGQTAAEGQESIAHLDVD
jgi:hypothetical protein